MAITNNTKMFTGIKTIIYCYNYLLLQLPTVF